MASLSQCLAFVSSALLCLSHTSCPVLSSLAIFSCHDPVPSEALSSLFCFLLPLLCPLHLFHAPACYLQSAAQLQFLLLQLLPNPSPSGSFFSLLLHFIVLFSSSDIVSTSHIPSLWFAVLLLHGCPFPLPPRWFPGSPCCSRSVCSLPAFVSQSISPLPSLFSAFFLPWPPPLPGEGGFILMQSCKGRVVSKATSISLTSFLPAAFAHFKMLSKADWDGCFPPLLLLLRAYPEALCSQQRLFHGLQQPFRKHRG